MRKKTPQNQVIQPRRQTEHVYCRKVVYLYFHGSNDSLSPLLQTPPQNHCLIQFSMMNYSIIPFILVRYFWIPRKDVIHDHITALNTGCSISIPVSLWALSVSCTHSLQMSVNFPQKTQYRQMRIPTRTKIKTNLGFQLTKKKNPCKIYCCIAQNFTLSSQDLSSIFQWV